MALQECVRGMIDRLYKLVRPMLFRLDAETAHRLVLAMLSAYPASEPPSALPELRTKVFGLEFTNPIGLAAGMDKDAVAAKAWQSLGFAFAELGTVTPRPQPGNPKPRVWRLPRHRALINSLGFPSAGVEVVARRVSRMRAQGLKIRLALNIGPNKDTAAEDVPRDYATIANKLAGMADLIVINLSSPNTPGLRAFQSPERLRQIRAALEASPKVPFLIKLSPDIDRDELGPICESIVELGFDGIVATNTTLARTEVGVASAYGGGLSGEPLRKRARDTIRTIDRLTGGDLPIIGVGGIASTEDAYGHIRAGASLVELYTGLIYQGPGLVQSIAQDLAALLRRDGFSSTSDAVGVDN